MVLFFDFQSIPHTPLWHSKVKWDMFGANWPRAARQFGWRLPGRPHLGDDGIEWIWAWEPGHDDPETSRWDGITVYVVHPRRSGMYHLTQETREVKVFGPPLTPVETADLHALIIEELRTEPEAQSDWTPWVIETLHHGGRWTRELPQGYTLDLIAASLAVAWLGLLVLHIVHWFLQGRIRVWRRWARIRWRRRLPSMLAQNSKHATP